MNQSATDATSSRWHLYGNGLKNPSIRPWVASMVLRCIRILALKSSCGCCVRAGSIFTATCPGAQFRRSGSGTQFRKCLLGPLGPDVTCYRGTSLIRNNPLLGPYSRTMSMVICMVTLGRGGVSYERVTLVCRSFRPQCLEAVLNGWSSGECTEASPVGAVPFHQ